MAVAKTQSVSAYREIIVVFFRDPHKTLTVWRDGVIVIMLNLLIRKVTISAISELCHKYELWNATIYLWLSLSPIVPQSWCIFNIFPCNHVAFFFGSYFLCIPWIHFVFISFSLIPSFSPVPPFLPVALYCPLLKVLHIPCTVSFNVLDFDA